MSCVVFEILWNHFWQASQSVCAVFVCKHVWLLIAWNLFWQASGRVSVGVMESSKCVNRGVTNGEGREESEYQSLTF